MACEGASEDFSWCQGDFAPGMVLTAWGRFPQGRFRGTTGGTGPGSRPRDDVERQPSAPVLRRGRDLQAHHCTDSWSAHMVFAVLVTHIARHRNPKTERDFAKRTDVSWKFHDASHH